MRNQLPMQFSFIFVFIIFATIKVWPGPVVDAETQQLNKLYQESQFQQIVDQLTPKMEKLNLAQFKILGKAQSELNNHTLALKTFLLAASQNPNDAEIKMLAGKEQFLAGKDREAMITLRESLDLNPKLEETYLVIEKIYIKKKNNYELRMLYQDMVERIGEKQEYISRLCELNALGGFYDLSRTYCEKGIKLKKDNPHNYVYLAMTLKETGAAEQAKTLYKKTATDFKDSEEVQLAYAQYLDEQKDFLDSTASYRAATQDAPKSIKAWVGLAMSSMEIQKYQDTLDALTTACKLNRQTVAQVHKVMAALKTLNQQIWFDKFELLSETCGMP